LEKRRLTQKIIWPIVFVYLLQTYLFSYELFFVISVTILCVYAIAQKGVLKVPRVPGVIGYVLVLLFMTFIGFAQYSVRLVTRDVFYEFSNILLICLGYYLYKKRSDFEDIITTTVCMVTITSILTLILGAISLIREPSFTTMRDSFSIGIKSIEVLFPILTMYVLVEKKVVISKVVDKIIILLWGIQTVLNLSRVTIVGIVAALITCVLVMIINRKIAVDKIVKVVGIVIIVLCLICVIWRVIPDDISNHFVDKIENTISEITVATEYNSLAEAQSNWRGYEISCAQQQWWESDLVSKVVGKGNGTLISIFYIPDGWKAFVEVQNGETGITVLHNTYYTLLIKGGIIAVVLFLRMFLLNIRKGMRCYRIQKNDMGMYLVVLCVVMLIDAYVIRGMVQNDAQMTWSLLFGWLNAKISSDLIVQKRE